MWGAYHGLLLIGYRLFDRATVGTAVDKVMKKHWFVPFSVGAMFTAFVLSAPFFRAKTLQSSGYVLSALFGFHAYNRGIPAHDRHDRADFHFAVSRRRPGTQSIY